MDQILAEKSGDSMRQIVLQVAEDDCQQDGLSPIA
jgi:hypothetical protein